MSPDPPESVERHISVGKIETEEKVTKKTLNSSVIFCNFPNFPKILDLGKYE